MNAATTFEVEFNGTQHDELLSLEPSPSMAPC